MPAEKLSVETVKKLQSTRSRQKEEITNEDVFTIVGIHGKREHRKKLQYRVSWLGYEERTWEWAGNIPLFIRNYYHQCGKDETLLPPPRLEPANLGKDSYYYLTWEGSDVPGTYVKASDLILPDQEDKTEETGITCNTKNILVADIIEELLVL